VPRPPRPRRRRVYLALLVLTALLAALAAFGVAGYRAALRHPVRVSDGQVVVVVEPGARAVDVLEALARDGVIDSPRIARIYLRRNDLEGRLRAGTFTLTQDMSLEQALLHLTRADGVLARRITIPEGLRIDEIAERFDAAGVGDVEAVLRAAVAGPWGSTQADAEGRFHPDTYEIDQTSTAARLLARMAARADEIWDDVVAEAPERARATMERYDLDRRGVLTVASIVEAEATVPEEHGLIAAVIYNRLRAGMRLQMDPTCAYPEAYRAVRLYDACHDPANPYSTYEIDGLPPGPINNPGRRALHAALYPAEGDGVDELLYFVARQDGSGRHAFAATYDEHRRNVDRYLR
jgi:UPF0755 protein